MEPRRYQQSLLDGAAVSGPRLTLRPFHRPRNDDVAWTQLFLRRVAREVRRQAVRALVAGTAKRLGAEPAFCGLAQVMCW